jgi:hypothetical protein
MVYSCASRCSVCVSTPFFNVMNMLMVRCASSLSDGKSSAAILSRLLLRKLQMASTTQSLDQKNAERFDPFIFWGINVCWVALLLSFIFWIWKCNGAQALIGWRNFNSSNINSYQRSGESQDDDSPEGKREKLMEYFRQRKVQMVSHIIR